MSFKVLFVAGFGPIPRDDKAARKLYQSDMGIPFKEDDGYLHTEKLEGVKHFALWPLAGAARSCFGTDSWPADLPVPQAWIEYDVDDVAKATADLQADGYRMLVENRQEPWGKRFPGF
jgi:hypothetical protein